MAMVRGCVGGGEGRNGEVCSLSMRVRIVRQVRWSGGDGCQGIERNQLMDQPVQVVLYNAFITACR